MTNYKELLTNNIKKLRKKSGLTQERFAKLVNITVEGYRNIEKSRYVPKPDTIDKICKAFNLTPSELLLPDSLKDETLVNEINCKLNLCNPDDLRRISKMIDLIRH